MTNWQFSISNYLGWQLGAYRSQQTAPCAQGSWRHGIIYSSHVCTAKQSGRGPSSDAIRHQYRSQTGLNCCLGSEQHHPPTSACLGSWQLNQPFITCGNRETIWFTTRYPYRPQHSSTTSTESWETSSQQGDIGSGFIPSWSYGWDKGNLEGFKCGSSCFLFLFCQDASVLSYCSCKNF